MKKLAVIIFTTEYKKGGDKFKIVAQTLSKEKAIEGFDIICHAINSKQELVHLFKGIEDRNNKILEFHFIGHSGMYGPMLGSKSYPEQFSPYELQNLSIPFADNAVARFHACRSARWFAPYFARVQNVKTYGYHWYTSFSQKKDKFKFTLLNKNKSDLYLIGCPGLKSHGIIATIKKFLGFMKAENWKEFEPSHEPIDRTYNQVADLYSATFEDIKVRRDEYKWITKHLPDSNTISILDIGCGNGALLKELRHEIQYGVGVDVSDNLIKNAQTQNKQYNNLEFVKINGPVLPFDDDTFNVVISMLSFRYLDWDPIIEEINRVLKNKGKIIIIDMVTSPIKMWEVPMFLKNKFDHYLSKIKQPVYHHNLNKLVTHKGWRKMLNYNPIRSKHEMEWYLISRFPDSSIKTLNIGLHSRIIAFEATHD